MTDQDRQTIQTMIHYGGAFIKAFGEACFHADDENLRRLKLAFPEYWRLYESFRGGVGDVQRL